MDSLHSVELTCKFWFKVFWSIVQIFEIANKLMPLQIAGIEIEPPKWSIIIGGLTIEGKRLSNCWYARVKN